MPTSVASQVQRMAATASNWKHRYKLEQEFFPFNEKEETVLLPIRHFNSDHPVTPGEWKGVPYNVASQPRYAPGTHGLPLQPALVGGGYYLWHMGMGIAIDPGHGFVDSLHRYHGVTVHHIDAVIITHDHMDHHADLETIIALRRGAARPLRVITNQQVSDAYALEQRGQITGPDVAVDIVRRGDLGEPVHLSRQVEARFLPAAHWQRVRTIHAGNRRMDPLEILDGHLSALGVQIILKRSGGVRERRVLITGDTLWPVRCDGEWFAYGDHRNCPYCDRYERLGQFGWVLGDLAVHARDMADRVQKSCREMVRAYQRLDKSEVVCLHIGSLEKSLAALGAGDEKAILERIDEAESAYTGLHLGLLGALRVVRTLVEAHRADATKGFDAKTGLVVLTEFGEELLGNRQNLCAVYKKLAQNMLGCAGINALPSEVTLRVRLHHANEEADPKQGVACSYCERYHPWEDATAREEQGEIITFMANTPEHTHTNCAYWSR